MPELPRKPKAKNPYRILGSNIAIGSKIKEGTFRATSKVHVIEQKGSDHFLAKKYFIDEVGRRVVSKIARRSRILHEAKMLRFLGRNGFIVPENIKVDLRKG
ncbi:MAG: hypothetical protein Q7K42_02040, partial [Candidatus Diapherotrites archaeon]|nr:hypothetical protein [Candidatus Diapherotrites archaeon]